MERCRRARTVAGSEDRSSVAVIRLAADENFNNNIIRGVRRRNPAIDVLRVQAKGWEAVLAEDSGRGSPS
jgi:hypothetical protein